MPSELFRLIGETPLIELRSCSPKPGIHLFAKLEGQNPTGSVKDRVVSFMVQRALAEGRLRPGQEIVEASTGNTGIALAMVGRVLGHPVRIVVPHTTFPDISQALKAWGASVEWVPADLGIKSAIDSAKDIASKTGAFFLGQFESGDNALCHYETTAVEILKQVQQVDVFVCGLGTGGTVMGVGRRLREANPDTRIVAAEPHPGTTLQGLRSLAEGYIPPILDTGRLDAKILVRSVSAFRAARELLQRESVLAGLSSGAVLHAALKWCQRIESGNVVLLFADSGWKYLNSPAFQLDVPLDDEHEELDDIIWW